MITDAGGAPTEAGGRVRTGLLYRVSGALAGEEELIRLGAVGLERLVDLRGPDEDRTAVEAWAAAAGVEYVHEPIAVGNVGDLAAAVAKLRSREEAEEHLRSIYRAIVDEHGDAVAATIAAVAERQPAGYGCAAGKDRTGVVTALLHSLLGVAEAEVARRYVDGAPGSERLQPLARRYLGLADGEPLPVGIEVMLAARETTIREVLAHLRSEYGGAASYLEAHGLRAEAVEALRRAMLTPAP